MPKMTKEEMEKAGKLAEDKMRTIDFQVDTVTVDMADGAAAYYRRSNNTITANYEIDGNASSHRYNQGLETLTHEQKHRDNYLQGMYAYAVSSEQAYKREMHDEISANIAELISLREEYIRTGDISVFDKESKFAFYKEAIEKGEINPNSPYPEDFDKEMRLIVNGTQKMWMENFGNDFYIKNGVYHYLAEGDFEGKYAQYWDENYQNAMKIAYNIGGVDFTKYMDKDVEIPDAANIKIAEELSKFTSFYQKENPLLSDEAVTRIVFEKSGLPPYDGSMSLNEYKKLLQHQLAVNNFTSNHKEIFEYDPKTKEFNVKKCTPQEYLSTINIDKYKKEYEQLVSPSNPYAEQNKEDFPTLDAYLKSNPEIQDFYYKFNEIKDKEAFIDKMVEYQAQEYVKSGKKIPLEDNEANYKKALEQVYCGAYEVLQPDENKLKSNLSANVEQIVNDSNKSWFAKLRDKAQNLKHRLTYIKDTENNNEQYVGLWGKFKYKANGMKKDLISKVRKWLKQEKEKPINVTEIKNEQTHPVNTQEPQYPEWKNEDGSRVSSVQHRKILDMTKPIIKQPTKSRADKQQYNNSSKTATVVNMKSDSKKAQKDQKKLRQKTSLKDQMKADANKTKRIISNSEKNSTTSSIKNKKENYVTPQDNTRVANSTNLARKFIITER